LIVTTPLLSWFHYHFIQSKDKCRFWTPTSLSTLNLSPKGRRWARCSLRKRRSPLLLALNQCVVYKFQCNLCDADYVGYTTRHLHQRISEHKYSAIGRHIEEHKLTKSALQTIFYFEEMQIEVWLFIFWNAFHWRIEPYVKYTERLDSCQTFYVALCAQICYIIYIY